MEVRTDAAHSWLTPRGVQTAIRKIMAKGVPDRTGWRFVTVTVDPDRFDGDPLKAFLACQRRLRYFQERIREVYGCVRWDRKLEFTEAGWPHWHYTIDIKHKLSADELADFSRWWGYGRVNVRMVRPGAFGYQFKYAFKSPGVLSGECHESGAPDWFLDFYKPGADGKRPRSFTGIRFWVTSVGYYTGVPNKRNPFYEESPPGTSRVPVTVREKLERDRRTVRIIARRRDGGYVASMALLGTMAATEFLAIVGLNGLVVGASERLGSQRYETAAYHLVEGFGPWQKTLVKKLEARDVPRVRELRERRNRPF